MSFLGVGLAGLIGVTAPAIAGQFGRLAPSPAVPAAPLKAFTKVANAKSKFQGVWLIYSTGGISPYGNPPMSAAGQKMVADFRAKYDETAMRLNPPNGACVEPGMPSAMGGIGLVPMDIHVANDRITIISEVGPLTRRVFMNGQEAPDGYPASRSGWSTGKWEGDTLVITTKLMQEWLLGRWSHTEDAVLTERLTIRNTKDLGTEIPRNQPLDELNPVGELTLISEYSMHDPALYDVDPKATLYFRKMPNDFFTDVSCVEGLFWETANRDWLKGVYKAPENAAPAQAGGGRPKGTLLQGAPKGGGGPPPAAPKQ